MKKVKPYLLAVVFLGVALRWGYIFFANPTYTQQMLLLNYWIDYIVGIFFIIGAYLLVYGKEGDNG